MAQAELASLSVPVPVDPLDGLLLCVQLAAAEVAYFTRRIAALDPGAVSGRSIRVTRRRKADGDKELELTPADPQLHIWIRARQDATDRLARYSKMAIDAGIAERQVRLAEQWGDIMVRAFRVLLDGLILTPEQKQRAPSLVRTALAQLPIEGNAREVKR
jgi:hypothetical protein